MSKRKADDMDQPVRLDGAKLRDSLLEQYASEWKATSHAHPVLLQGVTPTLCVVTAGPTEASAAYLKHKRLACERVGFRFQHESFTNERMSAIQLRDAVRSIASREDVHGVIVQMPLPPHIDPRIVYEGVPPSKDVDGLTPTSQGRLQLGLPCLLPCTPQGVVDILYRHDLLKPGMSVAVVGRSSLVGRPLANMLSAPGVDCLVTVLHSRIPLDERRRVTKSADIVVSAVGKYGVIGKEDVSPGAIIVDVGINFVEDKSKKSGRRMVGDVDRSVWEIARCYTPVPGGVGPMTVAMLVRNVLVATQMQYGLETNLDTGDWRLRLFRQ